MGSFRIVTGSGYGRHEITDFRELQREFSKLKQIAEATHAPKVVAKKTKTTTKSGGITKKYDKLWNDLVRKANKWARETAAEMRASVPVDTGNLRGSIHILKDECKFDKTAGVIEMVVGVDLDPSGGYRKLYAPPLRKRSEKYGRKTPPWKGYRVMPSYPNDYSRKFLDENNIFEIFDTISEENAKKIMGK